MYIPIPTYMYNCRKMTVKQGNKMTLNLLYRMFNTHSMAQGSRVSIYSHTYVPTSDFCFALLFIEII